jgi:hypothetical protein
MDSGLNTILIISLILITSLVTAFLIFFIQVLRTTKRILTKIELRVDNFELTQEEIKLKILTFFESLINKVLSYKNTSVKKHEGGGKTDEKKDKE